jgi:hypothetical protein
MDVHHEAARGLTPEDVAAIHQRDVEVQVKYGVVYLKYWFDSATGKVFCLSEAPNIDAVRAVHRDANGIVADEIFEVFEGG